MVCLMRNFVIGFFFLAFLSMFSQGVMAQDKAQAIDAKIKSLEKLESRIDAKLKQLEELEARLEARLGTAPQPVAARTPGGAPAGANGGASMPTSMSATSASGASAGSDLEARVRQLEEESIHQVIIRGGYTRLSSAAESSKGALGGFTGPRDDKDGWNVGAVVGVKLWREPLFNNLIMGEVSLDYSRIQGNTTTLGGLQSSGDLSLFRVSVAPKYLMDSYGPIRPWITPIGLSFLVNSPPSDSATYLTVGGTTGVGVEYMVHRNLSVGVGLNYNFYDKSANRIRTDHLSLTPYIALNY